MFEFTFNVSYYHRVVDIYCMRLCLVYQTLILFSVRETMGEGENIEETLFNLCSSIYTRF